MENTGLTPLLLQARSEGFPSLSSEASVRVRGPPRILTGREVQYGSPGETVNILCEATAVPRIQAFLWLFQVTTWGKYFNQRCKIFGFVFGNTFRRLEIDIFKKILKISTFD